MLRELSDLALQLVRRTAEEALKAPPDPANKPSRNSPRQYFERLAKCLRETIALENRIAGARLPTAATTRPQNAVPPPADKSGQIDDLSAIGRLYKTPPANGTARPWQK
jgi:hypothetical protein